MNILKLKIDKLDAIFLTMLAFIAVFLDAQFDYFIVIKFLITWIALLLTWALIKRKDFENG